MSLASSSFKSGLQWLQKILRLHEVHYLIALLCKGCHLQFCRPLLSKIEKFFIVYFRTNFHYYRPNTLQWLLPKSTLNSWSASCSMTNQLKKTLLQHGNKCLSFNGLLCFKDNNNNNCNATIKVRLQLPFIISWVCLPAETDRRKARWSMETTGFEPGSAGYKAAALPSVLSCLYI